ncbi:MAG TPA: HdeD family acid-resistance protein [Candidatus Angelobacter sp.]|nr:HdeD family acid-resistance protein [Candidatus Angelobacter sp.]
MTSEFTLARIEHLRTIWGWLLVLGILMVVLGIVALFVVPIATVAAVVVLGWVMLFSGVIEGIHAFKARGWGGVFLHIAGAVLGVLIGLLVLTHPVAGAIAWTLLFASFFTVIGLFRLITAIQLRFVHWGWAVLDGLMTLALGVILWAEWPVSGLWFLGLALGISLLLRGWSYVMMSFAVRKLRLPDQLPGTSMPRAA